MRMRRKPWVRQELDECYFFVKNPKEYKNKWVSYFKQKQPIHLELGCGKGGFIAKKASTNLNINYIAVDIKSEVLGLAKRNIENEFVQINKPVTNVALLAWEIGLIEEILGNKDRIQRIYINFCNPWPKPRHNKRRLTYITYLEKYKKFLNSESEIYFKTDDDNLFKDSLKYFEETGFNIEKITYDLHADNWEDNVKTEHEDMFSRQGIKIKSVIAKL